MKDIDRIEGIGGVYAQKLAGAGIESVADLLKLGATGSARKIIADKSGIGEKIISKWVGHADLFRVKGVAGQFAELLDAAGCANMEQLAQSDPTALATSMEKVNEQRKLVRRVPTPHEVETWIREAKTLPPMVS